MTTTILDDVTIRLDAEHDLMAAGLAASEADDLAAVYRQAAEAICEGLAAVRVARVAGGADIGCDAAWGNEYGLWQAAHDCCRREGGQWRLDAEAVARCRSGLRRWLSRSCVARHESRPSEGTGWYVYVCGADAGGPFPSEQDALCHWRA